MTNTERTQIASELRSLARNYGSTEYARALRSQASFVMRDEDADLIRYVAIIENAKRGLR